MIPKPGSLDKRSLGIPCLVERAKQMLVKLALEPEWKALFESGTNGFRLGHSAHDAVEAIFKSIRNKGKYVFDADISKCFELIHNFTGLSIEAIEKLRDRL
jgi:RNA-directed DNA polymerase